MGPRSQGEVQARLQELIWRELHAATKALIDRGRYTRTEIAALSGMTDSALRNYMDEPHRKIPVHIAIRWAQVVGVNPARWFEEARRMAER